MSNLLCFEIFSTRISCLHLILFKTVETPFESEVIINGFFICFPIKKVDIFLEIKSLKKKSGVF